MKRTDLKVGVIYGYQRSRTYGQPQPVLMLSTSLWREPGRIVQANWKLAYDQSAKPKMREGFSGSSTGFLVARGTVENLAWAATQIPDEGLNDENIKSFENVLNARALHLLVVNNAHVRGTFDDAEAAAEARDAAKREEYRRAEEERRAVKDRFRVALDEVTPRVDKISAWLSDGRVSMSLETFEQLVALAKESSA